MLAKHLSPTNELLYSYNEGKTFHELRISDSNLLITNIIIEPLSISQQFVIYGLEDSNEGQKKGVIVTVDFASLHEPQCKGVERPGDAQSDYELWTPNDGRHDQKCFMGQQVSYIRRRQEAECFNGEELERKIYRQFCECSENDFECDVGYERKDGKCV